MSRPGALPPPPHRARRAGPASAGTGGRPDPLGKRALFGPLPDGLVEAAAATGADIVADPFAPPPRRRGQALFSEGTEAPVESPPPPERRTGRRVATVTCRSCGTRTALDAGGLAARLVTSVWVPGRRWNRYLRCPACRRPTLCRLAWGG